MSTLLLIRHGQASYGAADYDVLSERGQRQAEALGVYLARQRLDALYTGPLRRQVGTAEAVRIAVGAGAPGLEVIDELAEYPAFELLARLLPRLAAGDPELMRLASGERGPDGARLMDRALDAAIGAWSRGELAADLDGVESFADFERRVRAGLDRVLRGHGGGQRVAIVTSGGPIAIAMKLSLGLDPDGAMKLGRAIRNASLSEFRWRSQGFAWAPGELSLYGFNHVHHLPDDLVTYR